MDWNGRKPCKKAGECFQTEMNNAAVMGEKSTGLSSELCSACFEYVPETPKPKLTREDKIFFSLISTLNREGKQNTSVLVQTGDKTAMLVYFSKGHWERTVYPMIPMKEARIFVEMYDNEHPAKGR